MNLATLRPPANDTAADEQLAVTALRLDDGYGTSRMRLPGYVAGRIVAAARAATTLEDASIRRITADFLVDSLPRTVNVELVMTPMGAHGELSRFRLAQGTRIVAHGTVVLDTSWPTPAGASAQRPLLFPQLSEQARRMRRDTDSRFYRIDASKELSQASRQQQRGGYIRFRDARAVNAQTVAELSDGWSMLDDSDAGLRAHCTSLTLDFSVPLRSRTWDRLRFVRIEQQSDWLIRGALIEHGMVSTYDGEQLAEFQRVVSER